MGVVQQSRAEFIEIILLERCRVRVLRAYNIDMTNTPKNISTTILISALDGNNGAYVTLDGETIGFVELEGTTFVAYEEDGEQIGYYTSLQNAGVAIVMTATSL